MALKVKLSSGMKTIDTSINKPVVFINGQKKILDVGVTFVNGVKKYVWGKEGVPVDYIKTETISTGHVYCIGENWMHTSNIGYTTKFNISNIDNPVIEQTVAWGDVFQSCDFQRSGVNSFYGTTDGNKLQVNGTTGAFSVVANYQLLDGVSSNTVHPCTCMTNNYLCGFTEYPYNSSVVANLNPGNKWIWNGITKYETSRGSDPLRKTDSPAIQIDTESFIINLNSKNDLIQPGLYLATPADITRIDDFKNDLIMLDGDVFCGLKNYDTQTASEFILYDKLTYAVLETYTHDDTDEKLIFVGRIGDNYYFVATPKTDGLTGAKLVLLDKDDLSVVLTQDLESDPFNENNGLTTFWSNCSTIPQVSNSGYLSVDTWSGSSFRCARIGEIYN